jgi:hypothetical protein
MASKDFRLNSIAVIIEHYSCDEAKRQAEKENPGYKARSGYISEIKIRKRGENDMKVYELAKELKMTVKKVFDIIKECEIDAKNHMSVLSEEQILKIKQHYKNSSVIKEADETESK